MRHYPHLWISARGLGPSGTSTRLKRVLPGTHYEAIQLPRTDETVLPYFGCSAPLPVLESSSGVSRVAAHSSCYACHGLGPREVSVSRPSRRHSCWLPRTKARQPSRLSLISRLNPFNLSAYGLHACCPTLKVEDCSSPSKDLLPGGWAALPGRDSHPLEYATLPGRTQLLFFRPVQDVVDLAWFLLFPLNHQEALAVGRARLIVLLQYGPSNTL